MTTRAIRVAIPQTTQHAYYLAQVYLNALQKGKR